MSCCQLTLVNTVKWYTDTQEYKADIKDRCRTFCYFYLLTVSLLLLLYIIHFTDERGTDVYRSLCEGQSKPFIVLFLLQHTSSQKIHISVVHTCLMARSKEHVNVLTAVWSISFQCTHTYTPYTRTHASVRPHMHSLTHTQAVLPLLEAWKDALSHQSFFTGSVERKTALAQRVTLLKG